MSGRSSLPPQWRRWPADKMHLTSTLERGLVMVYLLLKRHTGSDTECHGARAERRNSSITSRWTRVSFFFLRFQSDLRPGPPWFTVPHVAKLNIISPNVAEKNLPIMVEHKSSNWCYLILKKFSAQQLVYYFCKVYFSNTSMNNQDSVYFPLSLVLIPKKPPWRTQYPIVLILFLHAKQF